jgi:hypothetical protein
MKKSVNSKKVVKKTVLKAKEQAIKEVMKPGRLIKIKIHPTSNDGNKLAGITCIGVLIVLASLVFILDSSFKENPKHPVETVIERSYG